MAEPDHWHSRWTRAEFFKLPMELRQRWWKETDYGAKRPAPHLVEAIQAALAVADKE